MNSNLTNKTAKDLMVEGLVTARGDEFIDEVVKKMSDRNIGSIVIVNEDLKVLGIFTERDVLKKVVATNMTTSSVLVSEVMTKSPETLPVDATLYEILSLMYMKNIRHVPIVVDNKLVGMISLKDASAVFRDILGDMLFK